MRLQPYLCLGGIELANGNRTLAYLSELGDPRFNVGGCSCDALEDEDLINGFVSPEADDAPWFDPAVEESADFLGLFAHSITLNHVASRDVNRKQGPGSVLSAIGYAHRIIAVRAQLLARSPAGMFYGERWLSESLVGSGCGEGCADDEVEILPYCPDVPAENANAHFRTLVNAGVVDGPIFAPITTLPDCLVQDVSFQIAAALPWLYGPKTEQYMTIGSADFECVRVSTNEQSGDGTLIITVEAPDTGPVDNLTITGKITFDQECPWEEGMPCFEYVIPELEAGSKLVIDGVRQRVTYFNPSSKAFEAGLPYVDVEGLFNFPDVAPCTNMCICVDDTGNEPASAEVTVEFWPRSL